MHVGLGAGGVGGTLLCPLSAYASSKPRRPLAFFIIMSKSIGESLRQARQARALSIEQVALSTHIRAHYLLAMETGDFQSIPSRAQARGFLRTYAEFLGLDAQPLLKALDETDASPSRGTSTPIQEPHIERTTESNAGEAARIFSQIGATLRNQRTLLGLSLGDIERHTHLKAHYLQALEEGKLEALPSSVQGRGMLKNYAAFLGLDAEKLLLQFAEALQIELSLRHPDRVSTNREPQLLTPKPPAKMRRLFSSETILGGIIVGTLVFFMLWSAVRLFAAQSEEGVTPTAPSIIEVLLASPTPTYSATPVPVTATLPPALLLNLTYQPQFTPIEPDAVTTGKATTIQVNVQVNQRTWMRVIVDGKVLFEGRVLAGSAYEFSGKERIEVVTGNGAALYVIYNQQIFGLMGLYGQVVSKIFMANGAFNPTPTLSPTPTETLPPTATSRYTLTPMPTSSLTPTP